MLKGLIVGGVAVVALFAYELNQVTFDYISLYLLGTSWLAYLMFFINLLNSITLKMLSALADEKAGRLNREGFNQFFNEKDGLGVRISSMKLNGFLISEGDQICLTPKSKLMVLGVSFLRKLHSSF